MKRHTYPGSAENQFIARIRDNELANPAPFSNRRLLIIDDERSFAECPELIYQNRGATGDFVEDVPIVDIVALNNRNNLDNFEFGMTFRDVLFECLHGHSLVQESLDYFLSDSLKAQHRINCDGYLPYPQDRSAEGKARGKGGVGVTQRGSKFFVDQGQQRTILAMFWIYQNAGPAGTFKGVRVTRLRRATDPA